MQPEQTSAAEGPDDGAVLRFLTADPEFFNRHSDVLPRLRIPHVSGKAVSLIERQVSVLRGKCTSLEHHLRDLIGVAHANEQLQGRLHVLVQEIISAPTLDVVVECTRRSLGESFGADAVHVLLVADEASGVTATMDTVATDADATRVAYRTIAADDERLERFAALFEEGGTRCGLPDAGQLEVLAGEALADIGSAALIPLRHEGTRGLVMLASRDESRFGAGKGVVFLDQLGGVLARRLHALGHTSA